MSAGLGFRVKSGWASAVLLAGSADSPEVRDRRVIELCDARVPASRQPYHAAMGKLQTDDAKIARLHQLIIQTAQRSVAELLRSYASADCRIKRAGLVVGSQVDPSTIANPHIRAHALEGLLFRSVLEDALKAKSIQCMAIRERDLYNLAARTLGRTEADLKRKLSKMGQTLEGGWRADDKAACLAGWLVLAQRA